MLLKKKRSPVATLADDAMSSLKPKAELALEKLGTAKEQAKVTMAETVVPALSDAKETVAPALQEAREKVTPALQEAKGKAAIAAGAALAEGRTRGRRAAAKMGVADEPKKKSHKLRNLLILLGLGGAVAYAYTRLTGKPAEPAWTASRDQGGPTTARHAAGPVDASETAPTAPLPSEETVESPVPTTPDQPLEKKDLT